jgi:hypothetical protein
MQRIAILYTRAGGGHRAAAHAIAAELGRLPATHVEVRDVLDFAPSWFAYDLASRRSSAPLHLGLDALGMPGALAALGSRSNPGRSSSSQASTR